MEIYEQIAVEALKLINFYHFSNRGSRSAECISLAAGQELNRFAGYWKIHWNIGAFFAELIRESAGSVAVERCIGAVGLIADWKED